MFDIGDSYIHTLVCKLTLYKSIRTKVPLVQVENIMNWGGTESAEELMSGGVKEVMMKW